jgi:hypothetical protein
MLLMTIKLGTADLLLSYLNQTLVVVQNHGLIDGCRPKAVIHCNTLSYDQPARCHNIMRYIIVFALIAYQTLTFADDNKETCENLAKLANSGELWTHTIPSRKINPSEISQFNSLKQKDFQVPDEIIEIQDGKKSRKFAYLMSQTPSSCWGLSIGNFDTEIETKGKDSGWIYAPVNDDEDKVDLSVNGADGEMVKIKDSYFVIDTNHQYGRKTLKTASIVKDGHIVETCKFSTNENPKLVVKKATDQNFCQKVVDGKVKKLPWKQVDEGLVTMDGGPEYSPRNMKVDINLDGKRDVIAWKDESSGGGCGSTSYSLVRLSEDESEMLHDDLTKTLQAAGEPQGHALGHDDNEIQIITYKNKPYILGNSKLQSVWGNKLKTWCDFEYLPQHQVSKVYSVK